MASHGDDITLLNIEFNSSCNLRCAWCALDHAKPRKVMSRETLERVMSSLAAAPLPNLRRIDLHNGGEALLHPDLPGLLSVVRRHRPGLPKGARVALLSNAVLLTEKVSRQILRSQALDQIRFSLDGGTPAAYEAIRRGARWEQVLRNVLRFLAMNRNAPRPVRTEAICILPPDAAPSGDPAASLSPVFGELFAAFDKVSLRHPHNWDGSADLGVDDKSYRAIAATRPREVCFLLRNNLVVLPDGAVTVCCNDLNARGVFGSILDTDFPALAADPVRLGMIALHAKGLKRDVPLCANCSGFFSPPRAGG